MKTSFGRVFFGMWNVRGGRIFNDDICKILNNGDLENVIKILKLEWKANFGRKISLILNIFERKEAPKLTYLLNIWIGRRF